MTRRDLSALPLRAAYSVAELARASCIERRQLKRALDAAGVVFIRSGSMMLVSISEIEAKVPTLWEGLKLAHGMAAASE